MIFFKEIFIQKWLIEQTKNKRIGLETIQLTTMSRQSESTMFT